MFFGLKPDRLPDVPEAERRPPARSGRLAQPRSGRLAQPRSGRPAPPHRGLSASQADC
jgi:hypothetical protein